MYCTNCGAQVQDGAAFCASCGTRVRVDPAMSPRRPSTAITPGASDVSAELRASVEARRELGPDMEDHVVESFLSRLDDRMSVQIDEQVARQIPKGSPKGRTGGIHSLPEPALVVIGSLALAIPLMGAGGEFAAIPVMVAVVLINLFYFVFRQQK
jgi:uncharacterized Zn finger protein (UPF0148 family)